MRGLRAVILPLCLPLVLAGAAAAGNSPAEAPTPDAGRELESRFGVLGRSTSEGRGLNDQLDRVVERVVRGVNAESKGDFQLKSAQILGGKNKKDDQLANAFALPDGRIYVTVGLMRLLKESPKSDDELAFVVGHELTHVVENHRERETKGSLPAGLLAVMLFAVSKSRGDLGAVGDAATAPSFSRQDEYKADQGGLLAMRAAGYDPLAAATLLARVRETGERQNRLYSGWGGTHPLTDTRIARLRVMTDKLVAAREPGEGTREAAAK
jgi:predicted Zn-dependent protease